MITGILLIVYVTMQGDIPDYHGQDEMSTIDECLSGAKDWLKVSQFEAARRLHVPKEKWGDMKGLAATCEADITGDEE